MRAALFLSLTLVAGGCDGRGGTANLMEIDAEGNTAQASARLDGQLVALAPDRFVQGAPGLAEARSILTLCSLAADGTGKCRDAGGAELTARVKQRTHLLLALAPAEAKTGTGQSGDPLAGALVLRNELICPELTLMASQSVRAFRIAAPGKREFHQINLEQEGQTRFLFVYSGEPLDCAALRPLVTDAQLFVPERDKS